VDIADAARIGISARKAGAGQNRDRDVGGEAKGRCLEPIVAPRDGHRSNVAGLDRHQPFARVHFHAGFVHSPKLTDELRAVARAHDVDSFTGTEVAPTRFFHARRGVVGHRGTNCSAGQCAPGSGEGDDEKGREPRQLANTVARAR
jgi:hypothetical protein